MSIVVLYNSHKVYVRKLVKHILLTLELRANLLCCYCHIEHTIFAEKILYSSHKVHVRIFVKQRLLTLILGTVLVVLLCCYYHMELKRAYKIKRLDFRHTVYFVIHKVQIMMFFLQRIIFSFKYNTNSLHLSSHVFMQC